MHFKIIFVSLFSSILLTAPSCKKANTEEQLPLETHEGNYTFGCKVDGVIYKASGQGGLFANQFVYYNFFADSTFNIGAGSTIDRKFNMFLTFKCSGLNTTCIMKTFPLQAIFQDNSNGTIPGNSNRYETSDVHVGYAIVKYFNGTFRPGNDGSIASGTFEMECINSNGKIIHITEGRFDIGQ